MARRAFVVNEKMREQVRHLAGVGVRQDDIAKIIGCAPKTLRKRCREDLDRGVAEANATVAGYLYAAAKAGNIAAIIFWLKTRGALARADRGGRGCSSCGRRAAFRDLVAARQLSRSRADCGAARCATAVLHQKTATAAAAMIPPISSLGDQGRSASSERIAAMWPDNGHDLLDGSTNGT